MFKRINSVTFDKKKIMNVFSVVSVVLLIISVALFTLGITQLIEGLKFIGIFNVSLNLAGIFLHLNFLVKELK